MAEPVENPAAWQGARHAIRLNTTGWVHGEVALTVLLQLKCEFNSINYIDADNKAIMDRDITSSEFESLFI